MNKPPVTANTTPDAFNSVPMATPTMPPTIAVRDDRKFMNKAILIETPVFNSTAKSPKIKNDCFSTQPYYVMYANSATYEPRAYIWDFTLSICTLLFFDDSKNPISLPSNQS